MSRYFKYAKPYIIYFILSPLLMIVEVMCDVKIPSLAANIVNAGVLKSDTSVIANSAITMIIYVVVSIVAGIGGAYCASKAGTYFSGDLREDLFKKIEKFSFANIDKYSTGSLITRLTNDITQLQEVVVLALRLFFRAPGMLIGAIIMSIKINKGLSSVFIILIPILVGIIFFVLKMSYKKFGLLQVKIDSLNIKVRETLTNIRVIKSLAREDYESEKFGGVNSDLKLTGLSAYRITILQTPLMTLTINLATIVIVGSGSIGVKNGTMPVGDITAFITYLTQIMMSVNMMANIFLQSSRAIASGKRISEVLDTEIDLTDTDSKFPDKKIEDATIEFKNVSFRYYKSNEEKVLSNINLVIPEGKTVGIIGSTGCGKTSLVQLIPRLYDVDDGEVLIGGINVKDYSLINLRDAVSVVLQNNVLFSGSITDNLKWGNKDCTDKEKNEAALWSASDEFIENLPEKYETILGQGGVNLSGGQKQRLCIARALLKNPKILILDDSTSAVDVYTESKIRSHLNEELKSSTKIIIAQRISTVLNADLIVVMNDGQIEATGTHEELLNTSVTYKEICDSQMSKEAVSDD